MSNFTPEQLCAFNLEGCESQLKEMTKRAGKAEWALRCIFGKRWRTKVVLKMLKNQEKELP